MKIISTIAKKKDRWDQLLEKTIHHQHDLVDGGFTTSEDFAFFDSTDDGEDKVYMNDEKLVVVSDQRSHLRHDDDMLKQIFDKEFSPKVQQDEAVKVIQKPPRKSLENRRSIDKNSSTYSSRNSMRFDD